MKSDQQTIHDSSAARRSARDAWLQATHRSFGDASVFARLDPARSLELLRQFLESWAHLVCIEAEPTFRPYQGRELRREPLAEVLARARAHLPAGRRDLVTIVKGLGDNFHHSQAEPQTTTPRVALAALLQCADLLEFLHNDLLREPVPSSSGAVIAHLQGSAPGQVGPTLAGPPPTVRAPQRGGVAPVAAVVVLLSVPVALVMFWPRDYAAPPRPAAATAEPENPAAMRAAIFKEGKQLQIAGDFAGAQRRFLDALTYEYSRDIEAALAAVGDWRAQQCVSPCSRLTSIVARNGHAAANLRTGPSLRDEVIREIPNGTEVAVPACAQLISSGEVWCAVTTPRGTRGWVHSAVLGWYTPPQ